MRQRSIGRWLAGLGVVALLVGLALGLGLGRPRAPAEARGAPIPRAGLERVGHIIVIYQENWSFDGLYGNFPGANGLANAGAAAAQVDRQGQPYATLPQPLDTSLRPVGPDPRFPADLPVAPFNTARFVGPEERTGDLVHRFYQQQQQINGGRMDSFVAYSDAAGLVMGYYDATDMPEGRLAREFLLADNFFHAAFGGSFLNHFWLVCACTPEFADAPDELRARLAADGRLERDGAVTPDGFGVNTLYTAQGPYPRSVTDPSRLLPPQSAPHIGDRLSEAGVNWAWYAGGWDDALAGHAHPQFQFHHQPFAYFATLPAGSPARAEHLRDENRFVQDLNAGALPPVSFIKALGPHNEHPGYASLLPGQQHVVELVDAVRASPIWEDAVIVITYDENGGRWDHVPPPVVDRWGPGTRVPTIIASPFVRRGSIDSTPYDTTSILRLIEERWGLAPLGTRDATVNSLANALTLD